MASGPVPQFLHVQHKEHNSTSLTQVLLGLYELIYVTPMEQLAS